MLAHDQRSAEGARGRRWRAAMLLVWIAVVACVNLVPRNGWDPAHGPVVPHDTFPADCSLCHEGSGWQTLRADFTYDHEKETGVALEGAHQSASCLYCHNDRGPVSQFSARGCGGCHQDPHLTRLGSNCQDCHNQNDWYPREAIALHDSTRFPLIGAHAATACFRCHAGAAVGNFAGASSECRDCHQDDFARTQNPNHVSSGFNQGCEACHLATNWRPARFDHPASFPLTQAHFGRLCSECHTTPNVFTGLSPDCSSCHSDDYAATVQPSHAAAGFGLQCTDCHDTRAWQRADWQHPGSFELTFGHAGRQCTACHVGQSYSGTQSDCVSCHLDDYQSTQNPNHGLSGFDTNCTLCHGTVRWQGGQFDHDAFPLENSHQRACTDCHTPPDYSGLDAACASCHLAAYQATTDPPHVDFQLSQQCQQCHDATVWGSGNWNHQFPITGDHNLTCFTCHNNPANRVQFSCIDCHEHNQQNAAGHHDDVQNYVWQSQACYNCHPNGRKD